jgi:hypothetical protein
MKNCIICDIDGTLAIIGNRNPYDASKASEVDKLNVPVAEILKRFKNEYVIIFMTGRFNKFKEQTIRFIEKHLNWTTDEYLLYMRNDTDWSKDRLAKMNMYNEHIKDKYEVLFVLDDRNQVVDMWREDLGLTCLQVAPGNF